MKAISRWKSGIDHGLPAMNWNPDSGSPQGFRPEAGKKLQGYRIQARAVWILFFIGPCRAAESSFRSELAGHA
jgi:hypothetical protein